MKPFGAFSATACAVVVLMATAVASAQTTATTSASAPVLPAPKMLDSIPPVLFNRMFSANKLVGSPGLAWKKKRVLTVAFHGGSAPLYQLIEQAASDWTALGGQLTFSFKDTQGNYRLWTPTDQRASADIRIGFEPDGYWSLLGVLAQNVNPSDRTMNFEHFPERLQKYFNEKNPEEWRISYERSAILHEFGHALGLSHEHFNPQCQEDLNKDAIIAYLMGPPNNWTQEQAMFNIDAQYYIKILGQQAGSLESKLVTSLKTDQRSTMLYLFNSSYYKSGSQSVCKPFGDHGQPWPTTLSKGDKEFYLANYRTIASPFEPATQTRTDR